MMINSYVVIDLETTGLDPKLDKIIEIGAVKVVDGIQTGQFSSYINPGRILRQQIAELTGINNEDLIDAPEFEDIMESLLGFLGEDVLLGHNLRFDYSFLKRAFVYRKMKFERMGIDTLKISRVCLPQLESRKLGALCRYYQIPLQAHRALNDAIATNILYQKLAAEFYALENEDAEKIKAAFVPKQMAYTVKKDCPATKVQKEQLTRLIKQHGLTIDYDIEKLTRSEASRNIDKIYSKFPRNTS